MWSFRAKLEKELAEVKQSKISPLRLLPTILITAEITAIALWILETRRKKNGN